MLQHTRKTISGNPGVGTTTARRPEIQIRSDGIGLEGMSADGINPIDDAELAEMHALIKHVGRKSVLEPTTLEQLGQTMLPIPAVRALVSMLQGPFVERWRERTLAVWALGRAHLNPHHQAVVATILKGVLTGSRAQPDVRLGEVWNRAMRRTLPIGVTLAAWGAMVAYVTLPHGPDAILSPIVLSAMLGFVLFGLSVLAITPVAMPFSYAMDTARNQRVRLAAARAMGRLKHPECLAALAAAALEINPAMRQEAEYALRSTLAALTADHYGHLGPDAVPALCRLLSVRRHQMFAGHALTEDLVVALLQALMVVGDGSAVPLVESIAADGWTDRAQRAASVALPILLRRRRQETDQHSLLRGANTPTDAPEVLLRSVTEPDLDPEGLLRASA